MLIHVKFNEIATVKIGEKIGKFWRAPCQKCLDTTNRLVSFPSGKIEHGGKQDIRVQSRVKRGHCTREYYFRGGKSLDIRYVYLFFRQADNITNWRTAHVDLYAR